MVSATRQTEKLTLTKHMRTLFRPVSIDSLMSEDGFDVFIYGQDFQATPEGNLEWIGADAHLGKNVVLTYQR